ncbi:hypothetical protein [Acidisoma silvae]|uniref:AMP-dependent synthetase/ligase domain-containing protein n=1 Tax=Acidisoma silvae TaxID=2802396 RepID=A0A963YUF2_9PROT|nr:hypothetical protein [Acidisoma silvae]MCB8876924.1 hypothetical protein [Acidisoma silvae]
MTAFVERGISAGDRVVLVGEITPSLLFAGLASDAIGATTLLLPAAAKAAEILAASAGRPPRLAVIQGHESLGLWLQLRQQLGPVQIVFDHAAPGRQQDSSVTLFTDLLAQAQLRQDASIRRPSTAIKGSDGPILWVEATTAWPDALAATYDRWLKPGTVLALPEILAAAARDRPEIRPTAWLASGFSLTHAAREIAHRLPLRLTGARGAGSNGIVCALLRHQARRRLGLNKLFAIEAETVASRPAALTALGISLHPWQKDGSAISGRPHHVAARPHFATAESLS